MIYHCCDERRRNAVAAHPTPQRHRLPGGARPRRAGGQPAPAHALPVAAEAGAGELQRRAAAHRRRRAHARHPMRMGGDRASTRRRPRRRPRSWRYFAALPAPDHVLVIRDGSLRRLLALSAAPGALGARRHAAARLRPAAVARSTSPSRSNARASSTAKPVTDLPRRARSGAGDQLPGEGLSELPPPDPRTASPSWSRAGRSAAPRMWA